MLSRSDQTPILHTWQSDLNYSIEAGVAPTIPLGGGDSALASLPALALLRELADQRTDMTVPIVLAGGSSAAWLSALFVNAEVVRKATVSAKATGAVGPATLANAAPQMASPAPLLIFTGLDPAMQMAAGGILPKPPAGLRPVNDRGMPVGMRDQLAPVLQPAAPMTLENLPFRILEPLPGERQGGVGMPAASLWMGGIAALLVLVMILGALIA